MAESKIKPAEVRDLTPIQRRMVLIIQQVNGPESARKLLRKFNQVKERQSCKA
jgi:hypothetical protein